MSSDNLNDADDDVSPLYLNGRPVYGPHLFDLETYGDMRLDFHKALDNLRFRGGVLLVPFTLPAERSLVLFLNIIMGGLDVQGLKTTFTQFLSDPLLCPPRNADTWVIHRAGAFPALSAVLEAWVTSGRVAVLTDSAVSFGFLSASFPTLTFPGFDNPDPLFEDGEGRIEWDNCRQLEKQALLKTVHERVALFDAWGAPIPFRLLARSVSAHEDDLSPLIEDLYARGILYWVSREKPPALLVATRGAGYAQTLLSAMAADGAGLSLDSYAEVFRIVQPDDTEQRYALLNLLTGMLADARLRRKLGAGLFSIGKISDFLKQQWPCIKALISAGSPAEHLLWGLCFLRTGLMAQADAIFVMGLSRDKKNSFLLQARARLLGLWSRIDEKKIDDAFMAFERAVREDKNNKHIWHSFAVFEAGRANGSGAEFCFGKALTLAPNNVYTLAARADMYLDRGDADKALTDLSAALALDPENPRVLHMKGRAAMFNAKWADAVECWRQILQRDRNNPYALHSLGHMARVRGHWEECRLHLTKVLSDIDPENEAALLEMGLMALDRAAYEADQNIKRTHLDEALTALYDALEVAPWNPKVIVSLANAQRLSGHNHGATARLQDLLQRLPGNSYAQHALALCEYDAGDIDGMLTRLQGILDAHKGRHYPALFAIIEATLRRGGITDARRALLNINIQSVREISALENINVLLETARLYHMMHEAELAASAVWAATKIDPENERIKWTARSIHEG